ncbi:MAG TPA: calcium-binding protein [Allocoleopsis sp.]
MANLTGTNLNDTLKGTDSADTIYGWAGNDNIQGKKGSDSLFGDEGNDLVYGNQDNDYIAGSFGNDTLYGGTGHDTVYGGAENDLILGEAGNDMLYGEAGDDQLYGGDGNDYLNASGPTLGESGIGAGEYDELTGGNGADTFSLVADMFQQGTQWVGNPGYIQDDNMDTVSSKGFAVIKDFNLTQGDTIQLDGFASHYELKPISWGQSFGNAGVADTAIVYVGSEKDKSEVVGVLQDVSLNSAYLQIPTVFTYTM